MKRKCAALAAWLVMLAPASALAAPEWLSVGGNSNVSLTKGGSAYFTFVNADSTTTSGPNLVTDKCDSIDAALFDSGATVGVKLWSSKNTTNGATVAAANLPQITGDSSGAAIDCSTPALCGVRDFKATAIVPTITTQCSTGTCVLEVICR
jgi:hypothetical protein